MAERPESDRLSDLRQARRRSLFIVLGFILAMAALLAIGLVARASATPSLGNLAEQLCEPESMLTRDVVQGAQVVTGSVNGRTPARGYAGYRAFVVDRATGQADIAADGWAAACPGHIWTADRTDLFIPNGLTLD